MIHYRIISLVWLIFAVVGFTLCALECVRLVQMDEPVAGGAIISTFIGLVFCLIAATAAIGLYRARLWARIVATIISVIFSLYCLMILALFGWSSGVIAFTVIFLGFALGVYTIIIIWILRLHEKTI